MLQGFSSDVPEGGKSSRVHKRSARELAGGIVWLQVLQEQQMGVPEGGRR